MNQDMPESPAAYLARIEAGSERRTTSCGDGEMIWHLWGSGPPLVLLHGYFGSWTHWIRNIEALSPHYRLLIPDMPGFGESAEPPQPCSIETIAQLVARGVLALADPTEPISVAGFSFGASIGACVARELGSRARVYVLVSGGRATGMRRVEPEGMVSWRRQRTREERDAAHRRNLEVRMIADPARVDDLAVFLQARNAEASRLRTGEIDRHHNCLPDLQCRLAGIWADADSGIGPYLADRFEMIRGYQPDARTATISGAGHWVQYEKPEELDRELLRMLAD